MGCINEYKMSITVQTHQDKDLISDRMIYRNAG